MLQLTVTALLTMVLSSTATSTTCGPCECYADGVRAYWPNMHVAACKKELNLNTVPNNLPADIEGLRIYGGSISKITKWQFKSYNQLLRILIEYNKINQLEQGAFQFLTNLTSLELWFNSITVLPDDLFTYTPNLFKVNLKHNKIKRLQTNLFRDLKYLKIVRLHNNEVAAIEENCFVNVPQLEEIQLYDNKLMTLDIKFIDKPNSLKILQLDMNPWHCDLYYLYNVMAYVVQGALWGTRQAPTCTTPQNLTDMPWHTQLQTELCSRISFMVQPNQTADGEGHPKIISNTNNVIEGHDLELKCRYHTPSRLLWTFNDVKLPSDFIKASPESHTSTLTITNIRKEQHGYYLCRIRNCEDCEDTGIFVTVQSKTQSGFDIREVIHIPPSVISNESSNSRHGLLLQYYTVIPATELNTTLSDRK